MTYVIELPALDGRDALGFLAALGTLRLLNDDAHTDTRLSFDERTASTMLHGPLSSVEEVVEVLVGVISTIPDSGAIPAVPATFPTAKTGNEPDPMRMPRDQLRATAQQILSDDSPEGTASRWLAVVVTDLATDAKGGAALTPYTAPVGQQSLRSFFTKPLDEIRKDPATLVRQALTGWRRVDGYTGEYLDHRALRSAADHPSGKSVEAGVPGATWLAIMALPLLRLTGNGTTVQATLWHHVSGPKQPVMTWPLWRQPLDLPGISVLLDHPVLRPSATTHGITVDSTCWPPLGVFTVVGAARQAVDGRKSAGVLAPITVSVAGTG